MTTNKRQFTGEVVSHATDKTAVVTVTTVDTYPKYRKQYRRTKRFMVHDAKNEYQVGDRVVFEETRPISRHKRWRIVRKVTPERE